MRAALLIVLLASACSGSRGAPPALAPPYPAGSLPALRVPGPLSSRIASYKIDVRLDTVAHTLTGTSTLTWKHTGHAPVTSLPFHLYMNAFKNEATLFMRESHGAMRGQKAEDGGWGWIDVSSIQLGDVELRPQATFGLDETVLNVPLPQPVEPGAIVTLRFAFTVQLPKVFARTGYRGDFHMIGQWFPKIGVLDANDAWHCEPFHAWSEFFADFGDYEVVLDVPGDYVVAATGVVTNVQSVGLRRFVTYRAEDVHDFAWMADPGMRVAEAQTKDGVKILVYHRPAQAAYAARHLEAARRTLETYSRLFYPYPWSVMTIVDPPPDADGGAGGMEYPTLVTTASDRFYGPQGVPMSEGVTIHEVGHNWFQGILASNEVDEAWLDEGLNEYSNGIVADEWWGADASAVAWAGLRLGYYPLRRVFMDPDDDAVPLATPSYRFASAEAYGEATYFKTAAMMKTLENQVGRDRFLAALGVYARRFAFQHPSEGDSIATLSEALGEDVSWLLTPALHTIPGAVELRVDDITSRRVHADRGVFGAGETRRVIQEADAPGQGQWVSEVSVLSTGTVPARTEVRVRFADGKEKRERWDDGVRAKTIRVVGDSPVVEAEIDPDGRILLERRRLDNALRVTGEAASAWRAGARTGFWTQTLLQLVGF